MSYVQVKTIIRKDQIQYISCDTIYHEDGDVLVNWKAWGENGTGWVLRDDLAPMIFEQWRS